MLNQKYNISTVKIKSLKTENKASVFQRKSTFLGVFEASSPVLKYFVFLQKFFLTMVRGRVYYTYVSDNYS